MICLDNIQRDAQDSARKLLETINKFNNAVRYRINLPKSSAFIFTTNKCIKKENMNTLPFMTASNKIRYID